MYALLALGDVLSVFGGMAAASAFRLHDALSFKTVELLMVLLPIFLFVSMNNRAYGIAVLANWRLGVRRAVYSITMTAFVVLGLGFALKVSSDYSRVAITTGFAISTMLLVLFRYGVRRATSWAFAGELYEVVVLSDDVSLSSEGAKNVVRADVLGLKPILNSPQMLDRIGNALSSADRVIVVCAPDRRPAWTAALKGLGINVEVLLPEVEQLGLLTTSTYNNRITAVVARGPLGTRDQIIKRLFDLSFVLASAPALLVVTALVALAIKLEDGGPVFFAQNRIGRGNRLFKLYKFRSMRVDRLDGAGALSTRRDDDRITRVGRILRSTSIDELPQLFNVLKSDMSVVGPRPHAVGSTAAETLFWDIDDRYWLRHAAKPGLTGLAQVRGFRGATSTVDDLINRVQADLEYLSGWSLMRDLRILGATAKVMLHPNAF